MCDYLWCYLMIASSHVDVSILFNSSFVHFQVDSIYGTLPRKRKITKKAQK